MPEFTPPTSTALRDALLRVRDSIPERYVQLLRHHYAEPRHTTTATRMAHAVGWKNHSAANLHYGRLATLVRSELNWSTGRYVAINMFVDFIDPGQQNNAEILWVMRPQLVEALEELGWVSRPRT